MKLPWKREPLDLVGAELAAAAERAAAAPDPNHWSAWSQPEEVAAGGWCAPSEVIYGLMDLPTVSVQRGGIRHR